MSISPLTQLFDLSELDVAIEDAANWSVLEDRLYGLCRQHPGHADRAGSNAKLWLIGRGLATGIERRIKATGGQGSSMLGLCDHVYEIHRHVDEILANLREVEEPLDKRKLELIVREHGKFCRLLSPVLNGKSPRSFAAKYLHCHCPAIPIYDNVARKKLGNVCLWDDDFSILKLTKDVDENYYWFSLRFLPFYQAVRRLRPHVTVRQLDLYLLWSSGPPESVHPQELNEERVADPRHNRFVMDSIEGAKPIHPDGTEEYIKDLVIPPEEEEDLGFGKPSDRRAAPRGADRRGP